MTKKHFKALATALRFTRPSLNCSVAYAQWMKDVKTVAEICSSFNERFDFDKFIKAAEE